METAENVFELAHSIPQGVLGDKVSSYLHENPEQTKRAFENAFPVSIAGIAQRAATTEGAQELLNAFKAGNYPHIEVQDLSRTVENPVAADQLTRSSEGFMGRIFGSKMGGVIDGLAAQTGVSRSSAAKLMGLASPLVLDVIGKDALSRGMDARGLSRFLGDLGRRASGMLPAPLAKLFGAGPTVIEAPRRVATPITERAAPYARPVETAPRRALWWVLGGLALLGALAILFGRGERREVRRTTVNPPMPTVSEPRTPTTGTPQAEAPRLETPKIVSLTAGAGVPALSSYLSSNEALPRRFILEGLQFSPGSADIDRSTSGILDDVAGALAARPTAKVRVEGHTDTTGDIDANRRLSQERADSVRAYLIDHGIAGDRIEAVGFGADRPMGGNDTDEGRARNRRTEVVVVSR